MPTAYCLCFNANSNMIFVVIVPGAWWPCSMVALLQTIDDYIAVLFEPQTELNLS
jgi:hypothetical protein